MGETATDVGVWRVTHVTIGDGWSKRMALPTASGQPWKTCVEHSIWRRANVTFSIHIYPLALSLSVKTRGKQDHTPANMDRRVLRSQPLEQGRNSRWRKKGMASDLHSLYHGKFMRENEWSLNFFLPWHLFLRILWLTTRMSLFRIQPTDSIFISDGVST